jgi:hypothetical protein
VLRNFSQRINTQIIFDIDWLVKVNKIALILEVK